ncbi:cell wall elongation regulator TseB-like domain-containing protein [Cohnella sp. 56]|uniref:cell wall elongation regulator TseB-like domain-containing protein n=1 Tax=Cohnella sp. 56 TaxID=3113722 RepID=UPI0030EA0934
MWTGWRLATIIAGFIVFVAVLFALYVRSADEDYRRESHDAIARAKQEAGLTKIEAATKHVWEQSVWVVEGRDGTNTEWFVWLRDDGTVKEKASDGLTQSEAEQRFESGHPGKKIVRTLPGWFSGQPAWEIRYIDDAKEARQAIVFLSFKDGSELKSYNLIA